MRFLTLFFVLLCYCTYVPLHRCTSSPLCHCAIAPLRRCATVLFVNSQLQSVKYTTFIFSDSS